MVARADIPSALRLLGPFPIAHADIGPLNVLFSETFTERYRRDGLVGVRVPPLNPAIWQYAVSDAGEGAMLGRDARGAIAAFNIAHRSGVEGWMGPLAVRDDCQGAGQGKSIVNAGVDLLTGDSAKLEFADKLQRLYEVDVRSTLLLSRLVGQRMAAAGGGVILNIGWDQAERGMEGDSGELFAAAKGAIMGFTRSLAVSLAPSVRVNCIAPGWIRTKWGDGANDAWQQRVLRETPLKRWGTPEDVAVVARFLASREASYLTGQVIYVNGGAQR